MRRLIGDRVRAAGAALCGPNSMGFHNFSCALRVTPFPVLLNLKPGGYCAIGLDPWALMNNDRRLRFSPAVSTGSETVTTTADYPRWMVDQPETRVVGLFLETVHDPEGVVAAIEEVATRDIAAAILKAGRSALSARMASSHTGAPVGDDALFRALVRRLGGYMAGSIDEVAAMLAQFALGWGEHPLRASPRSTIPVASSN